MNGYITLSATSTSEMNLIVSKKATGVDAIPSKIVKAAAPVISRHIASMANEMHAKEAFPTQLKSAQVTPIYKKGCSFTEKNYRPVSILPTLSKIYERLLSEQLTEHFNSIFHDFLSAFRASYGCQTTLLRLVEDWKQALDNNMCHINGPEFYFLKKCSMYNYADDTTVSYAHKQLTALKAVVESEIEITQNWFDDNQIQANPGKFQAIVGGKKTFCELKRFNVADNTIPCEETVKLLGVELDYQLNFNEQVSRICQKVARQLNVLQRVSKFYQKKQSCYVLNLLSDPILTTVLLSGTFAARLIPKN